MAYLTWEQYRAMGGSSVKEADFPAAEERAELVVDDVTLNRLHELDWSAWETQVRHATFLAVESGPALGESYKARLSASGPLTSYSNGQDSFGFGGASGSSGSSEDPAYSALYRELVSVLPVQLCSACVGYNHAR